MPKCVVDGCPNEARSLIGKYKDLCNKHRQRARKYGDPSFSKTAGTGEPDKFLIAAINYKCCDDENCHNPEHCLIWPYYRGSTGYAIISRKKKPASATRIICEAVHGKPPTKKHEAAHSCGKGHLGCVNQRHLSWKTSEENKADQLLHGTRNRGARNGGAKITEAVAKQIKAEAALGNSTHEAIAKRFGINRVTVTDIHLGRRWGHLTET
jgi:hypothetical protein